MLKFPYWEAVVVLMSTATMTLLDIVYAERAVARFWKPWTGALLKDDDVGHTLPASHERVGGCGLSMKASTTRKCWCLGNGRLASGTVVTLAKGGG